MNPAALKTNLADLERGRDPDRQRGRLQGAQPGEGRLRRRTRSRMARSTGISSSGSTMTKLTRARARRDRRLSTSEAGPLQELLRARPDLLDVQPADRAHDRVDREEVRAKPRDPARPTRGLQGRLQLRRDGRDVRRSATRSSRRRSSRVPTATSPATRRRRARPRRRARRAAGLPLFLAQLSDHAGLRHPPRAVAFKHFGVRTVPGRGRDRRHRRRRSARPSAAHLARDHDQSGRAWRSRPRRWAWRSCRAAAGDRRRAARRPSTGLPTKTEQADLLQALYGRNGEAPLPVRRAGDAGRLLRRGDRGGADRGHVHDAGDPALRRLLANGAEPGLPDVADLPRRSGFATAPTARTGFCPYLRDERRSRARGRSRARRASSTASAGSRRRTTTGNISYDAAEPRAHGPPARGEGRRRSRRTCRTLDRRRRPGAATCCARLGRDLRRDHGGAARASASSGVRRRARAPAPPEPAAAEPRRGADARTARCWCPELNMRPARADHPRASTWSTRRGFNKVQGKPFKVVRGARER